MTDNRVSIRARVNTIMWVEMNRGLLIIIAGVHRPSRGVGSCGCIDAAPGAAIQHMVAKTRVAFFDKVYMYDNIDFRTYGIPLIYLFDGFLFQCF